MDRSVSPSAQMDAPDIKIYKKSSNNIEKDYCAVYALCKSLESSNIGVQGGMLYWGIEGVELQLLAQRAGGALV